MEALWVIYMEVRVMINEETRHKLRELNKGEFMERRSIPYQPFFVPSTGRKIGSRGLGVAYRP